MCAKPFRMNMKIILLASYLFVMSPAQNSLNPVVEISDGKIRGERMVTYVLKKKFYAFRGIPYGKPPVDSLRFKAPVPVTRWTDVLNATADPPQCVQMDGTNVIGTEDCLYLSVYTPKLPDSTKPISLPVVIWFCGGMFWWSNSTFNKYRPDRFIEEDIVMVVFNYRVGVFGFFSTGDTVASGNYGLKDQRLVLQWVKRNIDKFGGDNGNITLWGQSAGAISINYHMYGSTEGLFHRAIMESGTSLCLWSLSRRFTKIRDFLGKKLKLNVETSRQFVNELRQYNYKTLQLAAGAFFLEEMILKNPRDGLVFAPVTEPPSKKAYYSGKSHHLLSQGKFLRIPVLLGFNSLEALINRTILLRILTMKFAWNSTRLVPRDLNIKNMTKKNTLGDEIRSFYFGRLPIYFQPKNIIEFIADDQFIRPIRETARLLSRNTTTYFYQFSYSGELGGFPDKPYEGVQHNEELPYFWDYTSNVTETDAQVARKLVKLWSNFIKYGNPTPDVKNELLDDLFWPAASSCCEGLCYLNIDKIFSVEVNPRQKFLEFWNKIYMERGYPPYDTY